MTDFRQHQAHLDWLPEAVANIEAWAVQRGIHSGDPLPQFAKCVSEVGELGDALIKGDREGVIDGIGDVFVTLVILSQRYGVPLEECIHAAWMEIADRKGKTVDGVFIKEGDS